MKYLVLLLLFPAVSQANFSKPILVARLSDQNAWNAPDNTWCFSSEPAIVQGKIHLGCFDEKGHLMARWDNEGFKNIARAEPDQYFSSPVSSFGTAAWYEFHEWRAMKSFKSSSVVTSQIIKNLGPLSDPSDSFLPYTSDSYFYRIKNDNPELWIWKDDIAKPFFKPNAAFIFTPFIGPHGEIALKTRDNNYNENSPDRLWHYSENWKVVLEDQDADPKSKWKSFRHQMAVEGNKILLVATDSDGEALILIEGADIKIIARAGKDLARFDYFAPKLRNGTIVVRGEDFDGNKVTYVKDQNNFRKLISQGDVVQTDLGPGRVFYQSRDAIFYGAPGIDERGNVVLQATLTDADHPRTLLGVGIIKFNKE